MAEIWKTIEKQIIVNSEIAASGSEIIISAPQRVDAYNMLLAQNRGEVDAELYLNDLYGEHFFLRKNGGFVNISPDMHLWFSKVIIVNLSAADAILATMISTRAAKVVPAVIGTNGERIKTISNTDSQNGISIG